MISIKNGVDQGDAFKKKVTIFLLHIYEIFINLITFTSDGHPGEYIPTVFDNYSANIAAGDQTINLQLWSTQGLEDYPKNRVGTYPQCDIFIILFSLIQPSSLKYVEKILVPEIKENCPYANYLSDVDAIIFLFDVADKGSFEYAKRRIISAYLSNAKNIKYYLAANFTEKRKQIEFQNQIIHYDEIIKAGNELNCDIFEINPNCDEDEYAMLYYIISKLPKPMKEKKIKRKKDKSHGKTSQKKNKK